MTSPKRPIPPQFLSGCLFVFFRYSTIFSSFCVEILLHLPPRPLLRGRQFWVVYWEEKTNIKTRILGCLETILKSNRFTRLATSRPHEFQARRRTFQQVYRFTEETACIPWDKAVGASLSFRIERVNNNQPPNQSIDPSLNQTTSRFVGRSLRSVTNSLPGSLFFRPGSVFSFSYVVIVIVMSLQFWAWTRISTQRCKANISEIKLTVHMLAKPSKDPQLQPRRVKEGRRKTGIRGTAFAGVAPKLNTWIPLADRNTPSHKTLVQNQRQTYAQWHAQQRTRRKTKKLNDSKNATTLFINPVPSLLISISDSFGIDKLSVMYSQS